MQSSTLFFARICASVACLAICSCSTTDSGPVSPDEAFLKKYPTIRKNGKAYKLIPNEDILMRTTVPAPPAPSPEGTSIAINLASQRAWLYKDGLIAAETAICPGKPGYETPIGDFRVVSKHEDWISTLYKVPMPYFLRLNADGGKVGLHAGAIALEAASHGCIRLPKAKAEEFFRETPVGTKVVISADGGQAGAGVQDGGYQL